jgi:hypothetical protein
MRKTGSAVEQDFYDIFTAQTILPGVINGTIYKRGMRPLDADTEDAVISLVAGMDGQIQTGVLVVNVYVPDVVINGRLFRNSSRCREIEQALDEIIVGLSNPQYDIWLGDMIQTFQAEELKQHFINAKLNFRLITI